MESRQSDLNMLLGRIQERVQNLQHKVKDQSQEVKSEIQDIEQQISFLKSQLNKHKVKHTEQDKKMIKTFFITYGLIIFMLILIFILSLENETALEIFKLIELL